MEFWQLQYFQAVAEELNFSRAAKRLNIAQPPLTRQIRQLEQELGVELFYRTKRYVQLTDAGKAFLEESRHILEQVEQSVLLAQRANRGEIGRLVVAFEGSSAYDIVPRSLKQNLSRTFSWGRTGCGGDDYGWTSASFARTSNRRWIPCTTT